MENSESLSLAYLAAHIRRSGIPAGIFNAALKRKSADSLLEELVHGKYDLVGFTLSDPELVLPTLGLVIDLRQSGYSGHITLGGHTATFHANELLEMSDAIDSIVLHEGEHTLFELCRAIEVGGNWVDVPGLASRSERFRRVAVRPPIADLNQIRPPVRDDLPWVLENKGVEAAVPVLTSRGCYFRCGFCSVRAFYERSGRPSWRRRTVADVTSELSALVAQYGVKDFLFVDDLFLSRSRNSCRYAEEFADDVVQSGLDITFTVSATVDSVRSDTFESLREAGLRQVYLGAEAAHPEMLRYLGKWFEPEDIAKAAQTLEDLAIDYSMSFINFTPHSSLEHIRANLSFFSTIPFDIIPGLLNRYQVYGGTPLFEQLRSAGRLLGAFPHLDYIGEDQRVDVLHDCCRKTLGPLLELSRSIKAARRLVALREREVREPRGRLGTGSQRRSTLTREATLRVNKEVARLFDALVERIENQGLSRVGDLDPDFVREVRMEAARIEDSWSRVFKSISRMAMADDAEYTMRGGN